MTPLRLLALVAAVLAVLVLAGSLISGLGGRAAPSRPEEPAAADPAADRIRVEVLNAAGISGLAREATERLRSAGYDVVYYGNASSFGRDTSVVLDRVGSPRAARAVARAIDIARVEARPDTTLYLDVTVILGSDWSGIPAAPIEPEPAAPIE